MLINKEKGTTTTQFCEYIKSSDPQETEIYGMYAATQLANKLHREQQQNTTILCDCKKVVKYVTKKYRVPWKYSDVYQRIQEELIHNKEEHLTIQWMPGHTDNKYNDKADELAKIATTLPHSPPGNRSLDGLPIRHFRPCLTTD